MKKILFLILFATSFFLKAGAQSATGIPVWMKTSVSSTSMSDTGDIITNATDTARLYLNSSTMTNGSIQVNTYYVSGTTPIVTCFLETSNDGAKWSRRQVAQQQTGDTINLTPLSGISSSKNLAIPANNFQYNRISCHGHGTLSVGLKAVAVIRKDIR